MNIQYVSDSSGQTTGVFIPISEWNELRKKLEGIDLGDIDIPQWHIDTVTQRLAAYAQTPQTGLDFDAAMDEIDAEL